MKYKVGDKVKIVQFTETAIDAPEHTIGNIGTVVSIELDQGDHIYRVTFEMTLKVGTTKKINLNTLIE